MSGRSLVDLSTLGPIEAQVPRVVLRLMCIITSGNDGTASRIISIGTCSSVGFLGFLSFAIFFLQRVVIAVSLFTFPDVYLWTPFLPECHQAARTHS